MYSGFSNSRYEWSLFYGCPGGDEATERGTNILTSKNWGKNITDAFKTARGRGHAALPELKKQKTGKGTDNSKSTLTTLDSTNT